MYTSETTNEDSERTAFRKAEKKYKLYYDTSKKRKHPKTVDLSDVIDFKAILESYNQNGQLPEGVFAQGSDLYLPVFGLKSRPGFYFIPGALTIKEQCRWIRESLTSFPQPPNRTNHNAIYGPIRDLFVASKEGKILTEVESLSKSNGSGVDVIEGNDPKWKFSEEQCVTSGGSSSKSVSASVLLRKLRWSTLGLQFDWSKRSYNISLPHQKIPDALCQLAKTLAAPAMPPGEVFQPEAAIVNYFSSGARRSWAISLITVLLSLPIKPNIDLFLLPGDMLGGHLDDMEKDWSKPIVSLSLACKAIFLLGGKTREDTPLAMFLRSGDIVLMAGEARECFHGVPRIFTDGGHAEISDLESCFSHEDDSSFLEYCRTSRININIRQVD
ncbi:hypothetical protein Leryth_010812 [Lithospermum erythrorhizon]|nr:hypothetical protein Leryth_010812 [Lithospermum erythrorhizon]